MREEYSVLLATHIIIQLSQEKTQLFTKKFFDEFEGFLQRKHIKTQPFSAVLSKILKMIKRIFFFVPVSWRPAWHLREAVIVEKV